MRLGQLARKYDVSVQDILSYLKSKGIEAKSHPNSKLDEEAEALVMEHFSLLLPDDEGIAEDIAEIGEAEEEPALVAETETESDQHEAVAQETQKEVEAKTEDESSESASMTAEAGTAQSQDDIEEPAPTEEEVILSTQLLEMLENEEELSPEELEKIKLIKAPKKELAGLKVVGKIDLPEPKPKETKEEREARLAKNGKRRNQISEEEREKRRLRAKKRKEEYEARKKKREEEKAEKKKKALKEAHYKQKLEKAPPAPPAVKPKKKKKQLQREVESQQPKPKTVLGKFWRWLNT